MVGLVSKHRHTWNVLLATNLVDIGDRLGGRVQVHGDDGRAMDGGHETGDERRVDGLVGVQVEHYEATLALLVNDHRRGGRAHRGQLDDAFG